MNASSTPWQTPVVVLDANAKIPRAATTRAVAPNQFATAAECLATDLTSRLVGSAELTDRLRLLSQLARFLAPAESLDMPSTEESNLYSELSRLGIDDDERAHSVEYDEFFAVRRALTLDDDSWRHTLAVVCELVLADLVDTQLGVHELVAVLRGLVLVTEWIGTDTFPGGPAVGQMVEGRFGPRFEALDRFRLGHLLFAVLCNFATDQLDRAAVSLDGSYRAALLDRATVAVRATTAAMWYSVSFPASVYGAVVRPHMDAASTDDHGFSGQDNYDFRRLREAWESLAQEFCTMDCDDETLAAARRLYETVVRDAEHHTMLAAEMVGTLPSLDGGRTAARFGFEGQPAVDFLRMIIRERSTLFDPSRYGTGTVAMPKEGNA